jgi:predicted nuclease with TOPRIM domain
LRSIEKRVNEIQSRFVGIAEQEEKLREERSRLEEELREILGANTRLAMKVQAVITKHE